MNERPIAFGGSMVRAILDGRKTQTRRPLKPQPEPHPTGRWSFIVGSTDGSTGCFSWGVVDPSGSAFTDRGREHTTLFRCPYGRSGDRLWVRETWAHPYARPAGTTGEAAGVVYRADGPEYLSPVARRHSWGAGCPWKSAALMPRWASRITLEITGVRVERLQEISTSDALAEGVTHSTLNDPRVEYRWLWESIYGTGSWDANPWCWVVEFRRA